MIQTNIERPEAVRLLPDLSFPSCPSFWWTKCIRKVHVQRMGIPSFPLHHWTFSILRICRALKKFFGNYQSFESCVGEKAVRGSTLRKPVFALETAILRTCNALVLSMHVEFSANGHRADSRLFRKLRALLSLSSSSVTMPSMVIWKVNVTSVLIWGSLLLLNISTNWQDMGRSQV